MVTPCASIRFRPGRFLRLADIDAADSHPAQPSVFLSYASEDREAARLLRDALPGWGLEVWYDESELGGGEAWDQKIRRRIRECDYFMPIVSARTEARLEGYFRREWRLAVERTLDMADDHLFLLPVVIDDTDQSVARVPEKFLAVQWLKVPGGKPTRALESLCRRIASGDAKGSQPSRPPRRKGSVKVASARREIQDFPHEVPGQRVRFVAEVAVWAVQSGFILFKRLPGLIRVVLVGWLAVSLLSEVNSSRHRDTGDVSPSKVEKLKAISDKYQGNLNKNDIIKLGTQIASQFTDQSEDADPDSAPLLAVPFTAPPGDGIAAKLADSTFAMAYGMVSISHRGQVALTKDPLPSRDLGAALERGRANHSKYVLYGTADPVGGAETLTVKIATVADGSVLWSKTYPSVGADPSKIAAEVDSKIPPLAAK
jgi:hypothetical protein